MSQEEKSLVAIPDWPTQLQALKLLLNKDDLLIKYRDDENDEIGIQNQKDYDYALELARKHLNHSLMLILNTSKGQRVAEIRMRVDASRDNQIKTTTSSDRQMSCCATTQTMTESCNQCSGSSAQMLLIESQFNMFKKQITDDIESKLTMFMSHLKQSISPSPTIDSLGVCEQDFEFADDLADSELAAKVGKMLKIRSEAEAIGRRLKLAYFEEELDLSGAFNSEFIKDCNVPDGTQLRPNVKFEKKWLLKNTGRLEWNNATFPVKLICVSGNLFVLNDNHVDVKDTAQSEIATVSVNLMTPSKPGSYFSEWRLSCNGYQFGPKIWCSIEVVADEAVKNKTELASNLIDLTPTHQPAPVGFNNSADSFEEVNTSTFQENSDDDKQAEFDDDILVVPDCFNLDKEWKKRSTYASSSQSECNVEIFEEGLESRNNLTSTNVNTSLNSSFCQDLDHTLSIEETDKVEEAAVVLQPTQPVLATSSSSSSSSSKSSDEELAPKSSNNNSSTSGPLDMMKNAFKNLSGPSYVGYVCDIDANKENSRIMPNQQQQQEQKRVELLKKIAKDNEQAPPPALSSKRELTNMEKLIQMGFANRSLNDRLLRTYNNDVQQVVQHLIQRSDANWTH